MRTRWTLAAVALALVASVAAGWYFENQLAATGKPSPGAYQVRVIRDGRELASFDLAALSAIGTQTVIAQGSLQQGPRLADVLKRAGVNEFSAVTVVGTGVRDSGRLDLASGDIGTDTLLSVAKRGTVKVAGPRIPSNKRVRDVTEIRVR
jgi:hypothetical protein